jgi:tRNA threonylcarbamoyladenosine biosynthesis protein TsaE
MGATDTRIPVGLKIRGNGNRSIGSNNQEIDECQKASFPARFRRKSVRRFSISDNLGSGAGHSYTGLTGHMKPQEFTTHSAQETIALGRELAAMLTPPKLVLLRGELGAGKTTLIKGIAEGFQAASQEDVTSPTFTLVHEYRGPQANLYHIDLYRVDTQRELETLGLDDLIDEKSVLLIEWGEKFARFQRERDVEVELERLGETKRKIRVTTR